MFPMVYYLSLECGLFLSENDAGYNNSRFCPEMKLPDVPWIPKIGFKILERSNHP